MLLPDAVLPFFSTAPAGVVMAAGRYAAQGRRVLSCVFAEEHPRRVVRGSGGSVDEEEVRACLPGRAVHGSCRLDLERGADHQEQRTTRRAGEGFLERRYRHRLAEGNGGRLDRACAGIAPRVEVACIDGTPNLVDGRLLRADGCPVRAVQLDRLVLPASWWKPSMFWVITQAIFPLRSSCARA